MDLTRRMVKNSLFSVMEFGWPIIIALVASPYIVRTLGADAYGVLSIVGIALGVFGFLDLGMGGAAIRHLAASYEKGDMDGINDVLATVIGFYVVVGGLGALLIVALTHPLVTQALSVPKNLQSIASYAFYLSAPGFLLSLVFGTFGSIPKAIQRFDVAAAINISVGTLSTGLTVLMLHLGYGLRGVATASLALTLVSVPVTVFVAKRLVPTLRVRFSFNKVLFKELFSFGGYFLLSSIGVTLLYQLDKLLIGSILGVAQVTYYVVPGNLAGKIQGLVAAATFIIFPVSAGLMGSGKRDTLVKLYREGTRMVFILATMVAVPLGVFADRFLYYWMGPAMARHSGTVMVILVATYYLLAISSIPWGLANGAGRSKINAIFTFGIAAIDIGVLLLVIKPFGIIGAAGAYLLSAVVGVPWLIWYIERKVIGLSGIEFIGSYWRVAIVAVLQGAIAWAARPLVTNVPSALILMAVSALSFLALYVVLGFWQEGDKRLITMLVERFRTP